MKSNSVLFVGLALLACAAAAVLDYLNPPQVSAWLWMAAFAALGGIFLLAYLANGLSAQRWLFAACLSIALSEVLFILKIEWIDDYWALAFALAGAVVPFLFRARRPRGKSFLIAIARSKPVKLGEV